MREKLSAKQLCFSSLIPQRVYGWGFLFLIGWPPLWIPVAGNCGHVAVGVAFDQKKRPTVLLFVVSAGVIERHEARCN